jgi:cell division protein FtsA
MTMAQSKLIVATDLGSTTFKTLVVSIQSDGSMTVVGKGEVLASGFKDGDFVDLDAGYNAVRRMIKQAEKTADVDISGIYYTITGSHLRYLYARSQHQIFNGPRSINQEDIDAVLDKARTMSIPYDHSILSVNPVEYSVDGVSGILNPIGRIGSHLEVEAFLITGSRSVTGNIEQTVNMAKLDAAGWCIDALAAATALLTPDEKDNGIILLDIGGNESNWVMFKNGGMAGCGRIPWGGVHLTADLAHGLRCSESEAEAIKIKEGLVLRSLAEGVDTDSLFEENEIEVTPGLIAAILEPRLEEIFQLMKNDMGQAGQLSHVKSGIVLTGGGSRCNGSASLCEEIFSVPTAVRYLPDNLLDDPNLAEGQWASVLGLAAWGYAGEVGNISESIEDEVIPVKPVGFLKRFLGKR